MCWSFSLCELCKLDGGHHQTDTTHWILKHETPTLKLRHLNFVLVKYFVDSRCQPFSAVAQAKSTETLSFECSERSLFWCFLHWRWLRTVIFWNASITPTICWSQYQYFLDFFSIYFSVFSGNKRQGMYAVHRIGHQRILQKHVLARSIFSLLSVFCNLCWWKNNRFSLQPLLSIFQTKLWSFTLAMQVMLDSQCVFASNNHLRIFFGSSHPQLRLLHVVELQQ